MLIIINNIVRKNKMLIYRLDFYSWIANIGLNQSDFSCHVLFGHKCFIANVHHKVITYS